jgi:hypothetical protein
MNLTQLIYVSKATQLMGMLSLTKILDSSVRWNEAHELTGVLFYDNGHFCQLLEGDKYEILSVWERISSDPRHQILRRLELSSIEKRSYPDWKLRFYGAEQIAKHFKEMARVLDGMPNHDNDLLRLMKTVSSLEPI